MFKIDEPSNINTIFGGVQETTRKKRVKKINIVTCAKQGQSVEKDGGRVRQVTIFLPSVFWYNLIF